MEKILHALPDEGEDVPLRRELSAASGEGKEQFETIKKKVKKFRQDSQAFIGSSSGNSKRKEEAAVKAHTTISCVGDVIRVEDCKVCSLVDLDAAFTSTVQLFEQHFGNYPTHCPVFISFSHAKRRVVALKTGLCTQCLDPKVKFSRDHLSQCPVVKKEQFYTCKSSGCKCHLWLCTRHKDTVQNKTALEQDSKRLKTKHGLDLCSYTAALDSTVEQGVEKVQNSVDSAVKSLEKQVSKAGKELVPAPDGNPLFLFFGAKGKTRSLNTFLDQGSSDVLMKEDVPGKELLGHRIRKGPIMLKGVGGLTAVTGSG